MRVFLSGEDCEEGLLYVECASMGVAGVKGLNLRCRQSELYFENENDAIRVAKLILRCTGHERIPLPA